MDFGKQGGALRADDDQLCKGTAESWNPCVTTCFYHPSIPGQEPALSPVHTNLVFVMWEHSFVRPFSQSDTLRALKLLSHTHTHTAEKEVQGAGIRHEERRRARANVKRQAGTQRRRLRRRQGKGSERGPYMFI